MTQYTSWFVGMRVECVDDDFRPYPGEKTPKAGKVYTIRTISHGLVNGVDRIGIRLVGIVNPLNLRLADNEGNTEFGFVAERFRPVQTRRTDISIFTRMLHDNKEHA